MKDDKATKAKNKLLKSMQGLQKIYVEFTMKGQLIPDRKLIAWINKTEEVLSGITEWIELTAEENKKKRD